MSQQTIAKLSWEGSAFYTLLIGEAYDHPMGWNSFQYELYFTIETSFLLDVIKKK